MTPAVRPATSESWPSWAEIELSDSLVKSSGSEPYFRTLASWVASAWLKPLEPAQVEVGVEGEAVGAVPLLAGDLDLPGGDD